MTRRRSKGEGSIYRRKDGLGVGQYKVGTKRRYLYGRTRKEGIWLRWRRAVASGPPPRFSRCEVPGENRALVVRVNNRTPTSDARPIFPHVFIDLPVRAQIIRATMETKTARRATS